MLSIVTAALRAQPTLETPMDVMRTIEQKLRPLFENEGMAFAIEFVDTDARISLALLRDFLQVRNWPEILPGGITLKNAFRDRPPKAGEPVKKVPQSFSFVLREGLDHAFFQRRNSLPQACPLKEMA